MILALVPEEDLDSQIKKTSVCLALIERFVLLLNLFEALGCGKHNLGHNPRDNLLQVIFLFVSQQLAEVQEVDCFK